MDNRVKLQNELETICDNVYFQKPSTMTMSYPAIVYNRKKMNTKYANDDRYNTKTSYDLMVIDRNPDSAIATQVLKLKYCEFDRQYVSDGLNHFAFTINY